MWGSTAGSSNGVACGGRSKKKIIFSCVLIQNLLACLIFVSLIFLPLSTPCIDHNILITRFSSWFGIHGSILNWFKSYLTSRSFRVKCDKDFSSEHISSCGVPQGSVLGPLLFVMYTTPLSTLISSLSLNHHR